MNGNYAVVPRHEPTRPVALLLIDLFSPFEFEGAEHVVETLRSATPAFKRTLAQARSSGAAVIFCNDNIGRWRSSFDHVLEISGRDDSRGASIVEALQPQPEDFRLLKPGHSCFHATPLDILLQELGTSRLVLTGQLVNSCVFFTAHEAHMRGYELTVPADLVAGKAGTDVIRTLDEMRELFGADLPTSQDVKW